MVRQVAFCQIGVLSVMGMLRQSSTRAAREMRAKAFAASLVQLQDET